MRWSYGWGRLVCAVRLAIRVVIPFAHMAAGAAERPLAGAAANAALYASARGGKRGSGPTEELLSQQKTRNERVDHVLDLISRGEWGGLKTQLALARQWGCSKDAMTNYAQAAFAVARKLTMLDTPEARESMRAAIIGSTERIRDRAFEIDELGDALRANELLAKLHNLLLPDVSINVNVAAQQLTDTELRAQGAAWLASLDSSELETMLAEAARLRSERDAIEAPVCAPALLEANGAAEQNETG